MIKKTAHHWPTSEIKTSPTPQPKYSTKISFDLRNIRATWNDKQLKQTQSIIRKMVKMQTKELDKVFSYKFIMALIKENLELKKQLGIVVD